MKNLRSILPFLCVLALVLPVSANALTTQLSTHVWQVDAGVEFLISNSGSTSYLFTWTDVNGTFTNIEDPSFVLGVNQTYLFRRTSSAHPFVITNDTLPAAGTDGSISRTTTDGAVIDAATLTPIADFTADPAPTADLITWTPTPQFLGNYYYTCRVTGHTGMTGKIRIVEFTVDNEESSWGSVKALYRDK